MPLTRLSSRNRPPTDDPLMKVDDDIAVARRLIQSRSALRSCNRGERLQQPCNQLLDCPGMPSTPSIGWMLPGESRHLSDGEWSPSVDNEREVALKERPSHSRCEDTQKRRPVREINKVDDNKLGKNVLGLHIQYDQLALPYETSSKRARIWEETRDERLYMTQLDGNLDQPIQLFRPKRIGQ
jgi:hypothetical protein